MKKVERKLSKAQLATIWLLVISVVLTGVYFVFMAIAKKKAADKLNGATGPSAITELKEGEALSDNNSPMAYPAISEKEIEFIDIDNAQTQEKYGVIREPDENKNLTGKFLFHYYRNGKDYETYIPPIAGVDSEFNYEDLYAIEGNDGFGTIYYLTYLCSAIGNPLFSERIELPTEDNAAAQKRRDAILRDCGLTQSERVEVSFSYRKQDKDTKEVTEGQHKIEIGGKALSGAGFYFRVDNRPYVYYTNSEYFIYAIGTFSGFIRGVLVSEGLAQDSVYGPYLTTNFTSWVGKKYGEGETVFLSPDPRKQDNPKLFVKAGYKNTSKDGYELGSDEDLSFDLEMLKTHQYFDRIKNAFVGKTVGTYQTPIILTLPKELRESENRLIDFGTLSEVVYDYTVTMIESVITETSEITETGYTLGDADTLVKVTYSYTVGGVSKENCHAIIDLNKLDATARADFKGKTVGTDLGADSIGFSVTYNKNDPALPKTTVKYVLTDVLAIIDGEGNPADSVTNDTYVNIAYNVLVDGKVISSNRTLIKLSELTAENKLYNLTSILPGAGVDEYNETVYTNVGTYEFMQEFTTYEISQIKHFTVNEIVVAFSFVNASERNPYFGETFYQNNLENEYKYYGLNSGSCEAAVKLLGGVGGESNNAAGLVGETVAIGLLNNMDKYGLYSHKIYFEMPRMIFDASEGTESDDDDVLSDFDWIDTLGFTLYISDATYDENGVRVRYIGSDMYDIVAKVPAADFDFVEYGFVEFWARESLIMMDITKLDELKLEFNMTEFTGSYAFDLEFKDGYIGYNESGELKFSENNFEGASPIEDHQIVWLTASEGAFETEFTKLFGYNEKRDIAWLYNHVHSGDKNIPYPGTQMTMGTGYFNTAYSILQLTTYLDNLTEEEQTAGFTKPKVMTMHVKVDGQTINGQEFYYTYEFYRIDDRRIMVSLYKSNADGECIDAETGLPVSSSEIDNHRVSDYYIDAFSFKKLVNTYVHLLNGQKFDENIGYPSI